MNLGVVIAVSEYTGDAGSLPACREDGAAVAQVLKMSNRFSEVLHIETNTIGTTVKQRLADFAKAHSEKEIEEVFFYFTGHGEFVADEFYYLLTDYQTKKRKQTSLENSELDGIVRALSPKLFVKIVDACHSGVSYIKSADDFTEYLKSANRKFDKVYFMFSSQSEQFSYQNQKISYFTESILKSLYSHASDTIRYKDIMSYVSDEFAEYGYQTPLFVTQADFIEKFCDVTQGLKDEIRKYIQDADKAGAKPGEGLHGPLPTLASKLKAEAKNYCSKEEALATVSSFVKHVESQSLTADIADIFSREVSVEQADPPGAESIGKWLDQAKDDKKYFARPSKEWQTYKKRVHKNPLAAAVGGVGGLFAGDDDYKYIDASREVVAGFSFTTDMPFQHIKIKLCPKLPNVAPEECYLVALVSRTHLRLFWAFAHFEYLDWEKVRRIGTLEWSTNEVALKNSEAVKSLADQIQEGFIAFVEEPLELRLSVPGGGPPSGPAAAQ